MIRTRVCIGLSTCISVLVALCVSTMPAQAASPWWHLTSSVRPAILAEGGEGTLGFRALNVGDASTTLENGSGEPTPIVLTVKLPSGIVAQKTSHGPGEPEEPQVSLSRFPETNFGNSFCDEPAAREVRCKYETFLGPLLPFEYAEMSISVSVANGASSAPAVAEVTGGGTAPATLERNLAVGSKAPPFAVEEQGFSIMPEEEGGAIDARAGSHPFQLTTNFALNQNADTLAPPALPKDLRFTLPPGLVANAATFPRCDELAFLTKGPGNGFADLCPAESAVGVVDLTVKEPVFSSAPDATYPVPVFNLMPKPGEPARFGFYFNGITVPIDFSVRTGEDYGAVASINNITQIANFLSESLTIWGAPSDSRHDAARGWGCVGGGFFQFPEGHPPCLPSLQTRSAPLLTLPTSCSTPFAAGVEGDAWSTKAAPEGTKLANDQQSGYSLRDNSGNPVSITGCNQLAFDPEIEAIPDVQEASTATGLTVNLRVPQESSENAAGLASSAIRDITVALPEGVTVNPAGANGLAACAEGLVGFTGARELEPSAEPGSKTLTFTPTLSSPFCPTASKIGTVDITTPLLAPTQHLTGDVYVATQNENPFGSLLAIYLIAEDPTSGVVVKLPGEIHLTPAGQLVSTFKNNPEVPFSEASLHFGGTDATLTTPSRCGTYSTSATFVPWSGAQPLTTHTSFAITTGPHGQQCPGASLPLSASLLAGTTNSQAGGFSPLTTTITRQDGDQGLQGIQLHLPSGLEGSLKGVALCPEARANEGTCGAESQLGQVTVLAGVGANPAIVTGGKVYLTEKYAGAPFGLSIVSPVKTGPFDLEHDTANPSQQPACDCLVVRARIEVDPHTAELIVTTDATGPHAIPQMIDGIPVQLRSVDVLVNREHFTFNPTNCGPTTITGTVLGGEGASDLVSSPFKAVNCAVLGFAPKVTVSTTAKASRLNGVGLKFKVSYPRGAQGTQAWVKEAKFDIPKQLPARLSTLQKACLARVFDANPANCPAGSRIGSVVVHTPILPVPLSGPIYFVSHGGAKFPDAVFVLQGYGITIDLVGETFINHKTGVTSATFASTPDVPFESIEATLPAGPASEFGASLPASANGSFCGRKLAMPTLLKGQNGIELHRNIPIAVTGCHKPPTRAQSLAAALRACKHERASRRQGCVRSARRRFGAGH
jgi:hypothetical protein